MAKTIKKTPNGPLGIAITLIAAAIALAMQLGLIKNTDLQNQAPATSVAYVDSSDLNWSETIAPNYYRVTSAADFEDVTLKTKPGTYQTFSDDLGRPTLVAANINQTMRASGTARERKYLPDPLGWPRNAQVEIQFSDGTIYHGWLFNRSHLLAKSLGGPDTADNLVTGTRTQNVGNNDEDGGMGHTETIARRHLDQNPDSTILYEVEPLYAGNEIIPRAVAVDIRSDDGAIDEHVITYNAAKGFDIDYATGAWSEAA